MRFTRQSRFTAAAAVAAIGAVVLTTAGSVNAAPSPMADKLPPIKIVQTVTADSPIVSYPTMFAGANVGVAALNAKGGINGHPIQKTTATTRAATRLGLRVSSPNRWWSSCLRFQPFVVSGDHLPDHGKRICAGGCQRADYANSVHIAVFVPGSGWPLPVPWPGTAREKRVPNAKTAVILAVDIAGRTTYQPDVATGAQQAGLTIVDTIVIAATAADFTPYVSQVAKARPDEF